MGYESSQKSEEKIRQLLKVNILRYKTKVFCHIHSLHLIFSKGSEIRLGTRKTPRLAEEFLNDELLHEDYQNLVETSRNK